MNWPAAMAHRLEQAFDRLPRWVRVVGAMVAFAGVATWLTVTT